MRLLDLKLCTLLFGLSFFLTVGGCQKKPETGDSSPIRIEAVEIALDSAIPVLELASPEKEQIVSSDFSVYFASAGIAISSEGEHLHFMLDDGDIIEHFEGKSPAEFKNIPEGQHLLRVFAVKKDHTSYKSDKSFDMVTFYVNDKTGKLPLEKSKPMLFLNLPTGESNGIASEDVLLDFWVSNAQLGIFDYKVSYSLDGHEGSLSLWETYAISGLSEGKHKLIIDLIDPNGKPVLGNFNHTVRTFIVNP